MSDKINDGGPAFPRTQWTGSDRNTAHRDVAGMSLRDWYKGMALQGMLAGSAPDCDWPNPEAVARKCDEYADAMLAERSRTK